MVSTQQRFSHDRPCPVCDGNDKEQRGQGRRCFGFLGSDGDYAHCTRDEFAGALPLEEESKTYAHRLTGDCRCGNRHDSTLPTPQPSANGKSPRRVVAEYHYQDEDGHPLFDVLRYEPKDFRQRRLNDKGGWIWNLEGVRRVLYRLPELIAADPKKPVFIAEGEADVDRLRLLELIATTNPGGAGKWSPEYSGSLENRHTVVLADNDDPGRKHAEQVAQSVHGIAKSVRVLELPGLSDKGADVSDWLDQGHPVDELVEMARNTPEWEPAEIPVTPSGNGHGFRFTSLSDLLAEPPEEVDYIWDKTLPAGGVSILAAKPKVGKSTTARCLALAVACNEEFLGRATTQGPVIYLALEEKRSEVHAHFTKMGAVDEDIILHFGSSPEDAMQKLEEAIAQHKPALVVIDPLLRFIRVKDANDYAEMTRALDPLLQMARLSGAHILCVHHAGKSDREGGDSILGSTALFGTVDTALIMRKKAAGRTLESIQRYGEDLPETVIVLSQETGTIATAGTVEEIEVKSAGERIVEAIGDGSLTQADIRKVVEGRTKHVMAALYSLHDDGALLREGAGTKGDAYTYSVIRSDAPNPEEPPQSEGSEKSCFLVPTIYREQGNKKNKNNSTPENGTSTENGDSAGELQTDLREQETLPISPDVVEVD